MSRSSFEIGESMMSKCCLPSGCPGYNESPILSSEPGDAVRVLCSNEACTEGQWMHPECFANWEEHVLNYLRSCGRARSWSEKQRLQNLWTKKGYDLAFKVCDCKCGKGRLRKDLNYIKVDVQQDKRRRRHKSKPQSASPPLERGPLQMNIQAMKAQQQQILMQMHHHMQQQQQQNLHHHQQQHHQQQQGRPQLRVRTSSFSSTGSVSPPSSAGTPPLTPGGTSSSGGSSKKNNRFDFFANNNQAAAGNIFRRRTDFSVFNVLPRSQQNPYHIKMEDEGPHGNDETRCFVLTNLSSRQMTEVGCGVCCKQMPVYDKYPLIDGSFFLSPQRYGELDMQVLSDGKMLYLNAVCMRCLQDPRGHKLQCQACRQKWMGQAFMIGSMYSYDIFAALPCCAHRMRCKNCTRPIMDPVQGSGIFSDYSKMVQCPHCLAEDYHFIKPLDEAFHVIKGPAAVAPSHRLFQLRGN